MIVEEAIRGRVEDLMARSGSSLGARLGFEYLALERHRVIVRMPVDERTHQPFGLLHGGASVALAESVASIGGWLNVDESQMVVGLEINANHVRAVKDGFVTATGTPLHRGQKTQIWDIRIEDDAGRLICISRCTLAVLTAGKPSPEQLTA